MSSHRMRYKLVLVCVGCLLLFIAVGMIPQDTIQAQTSAIQRKYVQLGGVQSFLGTASTDERSTPDGHGRFRHYQGGSIYWHPDTGAFEVHGAIRSKWADLGWERSFLGFPTTDETKPPDGKGRYNHFQGGSIYWHPETDAHEVHGAIRSKWANLGWERSFLGYPLTDETKTPDGRGRYNHFQGGSIYWHPDTGAYEVRGAIHQKWSSLGRERSVLGYPLTDELISVYGDGRWNAFQGGIIYWHPQTGAGVIQSNGTMIAPPDEFRIPGVPEPTATPCGNPCVGVIRQELKPSLKVSIPEMILCSAATQHKCDSSNADNQAPIFTLNDQICLIWLETGRSGADVNIVVSRAQSTVLNRRLDSYGNNACRTETIDVNSPGDYLTTIRFGNSSAEAAWGVATPTPTPTSTATRTPRPTPTSTATREAQASQQETTSDSQLYSTIMAKVKASDVKNSYPYETELFVANLLDMNLSNDMIAALQQPDAGDRIRAVVHRVWKDWIAYDLNHMSADPEQNGQSPFRQLVIRIVQGRQGSLGSTDRQALYSFLTRSESDETWRENVRGVIGAINSEIYGQ